MDRYLKRVEVLLRPVLALEVLVPGDAGDAAPGQTLEQVRAPALAVEHQGERRRAGLRPGQVGGRFGQHPQFQQVRHHVVLERLDQLRVERLVQAQQGRASTRPSTARAARPMGACLSRASRVARSVAAADTTCSLAAPRRQLPESTPGDWGVLARGRWSVSCESRRKLALGAASRPCWRPGRLIRLIAFATLAMLVSLCWQPSLYALSPTPCIAASSCCVPPAVCGCARR